MGLRSPRACVLYLLAIQALIIFVFISFVSFPPLNPTSTTQTVDSNNGLMKLHAFEKYSRFLEDDRKVLCLRQSGLAPAGGIETWFWTMANYVLNEYPLRLYALSLVRPYWIHGWFYGQTSLSEVLDSHIALNVDDDLLVEECDIIISTGVHPPPQPLKAPSILLVHGSGDIWTQKYTRFLPLYDAIVCVSLGCEKYYTETATNLNIPLYTVPSAVNKDLCAITHKPREEVRARWNVRSKRVLGFLGRISHEKGPRQFVEVVNHLPREWEGIMAGPLYYANNMPQLDDRTTYIGYENACDFLAAVDAVLLPSELEGGPIVLLEAWAMKTPFFMRLTGLALAHPNAVQIIGTDPAETARQIHEFVKPSNHENMVKFLEKGYDVVDQFYTTTAVHKLWSNVVQETIARKGKSRHIWRAPIMPVRLPDNTNEEFWMDGFQVDRVGRSALIKCHETNDECHTNFHITPPAPSTLSFTPTSLLIEFRTSTFYHNTSSYAGVLEVTGLSMYDFQQKTVYQQNSSILYSRTTISKCFTLPKELPQQFDILLKSQLQVVTKVLEIALVDSCSEIVTQKI